MWGRWTASLVDESVRTSTQSAGTHVIQSHPRETSAKSPVRTQTIPLRTDREMNQVRVVTLDGPLQVVERGIQVSDFSKKNCQLHRWKRLGLTGSPFKEQFSYTSIPRSRVGLFHRLKCLRRHAVFLGVPDIFGEVVIKIAFL